MTFDPSTLRVIDTVTVLGESYVIYQDGQYTHAVTERSWDAAADGEYEDYTAWCQATTAVGDRDLALAILGASDEAEVITCAGAMEQVGREDLQTFAVVDEAGRVTRIVLCATAAQADRITGRSVVYAETGTDIGDVLVVDDEGIGRSAE